MLRKKKDNSEYEIDRELTWKFAIEKNAEYQEKIGQLEEENKKLNEEIQRFKDNAMQDMREITELEMENQKLKRAMKAFLKNQFQFWNWSGDSIEWKNVTKLQIDWKEYDLWCKIEL